MLVELGCANLEHYQTTRDQHIKIIPGLQNGYAQLCYMCSMAAISPETLTLLM